MCPTWRKFICSFGQPSACIRFFKAKVKLSPRKRSRSLVRYVIGATRWLPVYRVSKAVQNVSSSICVCAAEHTVTVCRQSRCFLFFFSSGLRSTEAVTTSWTEKKKQTKRNEIKRLSWRVCNCARSHYFRSDWLLFLVVHFASSAEPWRGDLVRTLLWLLELGDVGARHFEFHSILFYFLQPYFIVFSCEASGYRKWTRDQNFLSDLVTS